MNGLPVLITGATGIMGSWVLGEALRRGYRPMVLMRDADPAHARERLRSVLRLVGNESLTDEVRILQGDTRQPLLGLGRAVADELHEVLGSIVHCAACTSFSTKFDTELWETNVGGVANLLDFLGGSQVPLYYVSTAYVAGNRRGLVYEHELEQDQQFNNTYEQSKCQAERMVRDAIAAGAIRASIFRPGIIVGSATHGSITQFLNFYSFLRFIDMASSRKKADPGYIRVAADPDGTKNLVPVDWSARALWSIIEAEGPCSRTYHLTSPSPVSHVSLLLWANQFLGARSLRIRLVERLNGDASALEGMCHGAFSHYQPYLYGEPLFDRTNTDRALGECVPFPEVGPEFFHTLLAFARAQRWRGIFGCKPRPTSLDDAARVEPLRPKARKAASPDPEAEGRTVARCR